MKICPSCQTQYTDDTLRFCLQDGTLLTQAPVTQEPTVSLAGQEMETVARRADPSVATRWQQDSQVTRVAAPAAKSGSRWFIWTVAAVLLMLLVGGIGAVGLWLFLTNQSAITVNTDNRNGNQNGLPPFNMNANLATPTRTPFSTPTPSPTSTVPASNSGSNAVPDPSPLIERERATSEVSQQVQNWRSSTESGDINALARKYAPSVQYYRKSGASPEFIRADKLRAYRIFDSMSIRISNMDVNISDSGETATASFDKEWVFSGTRRSTGKVRQQLQFRRINGQWLITGERDIRVYYTN